MEKLPIHVACAFDRAMAVPALLVASSIKQTMRLGRSVVFHAVAIDDGAFRQCGLGARLNSEFFEFALMRAMPEQMIDVDLSRASIKSPASLFRLMAPEIFQDVPRLIYLDTDVIVCKPLDDLFDLDLQGHSIAACRDLGMIALSRTPSLFPARSALSIQADPSSYFNAGVLLMDCAKWRADKMSGAFKKMAAVEPPSKFLLLYDQNALNFLFQGDYVRLDPRWNSCNCPDVEPDDPEATAIIAARSDPWIIHFAGPQKPWFVQPTTARYEKFWAITAASPFRREANALWMRSIPSRLVRVFPRKAGELLLTLSRCIRRVETQLSKTGGGAFDAPLATRRGGLSFISVVNGAPDCAAGATRRSKPPPSAKVSPPAPKLFPKSMTTS